MKPFFRVELTMEELVLLKAIIYTHSGIKIIHLKLMINLSFKLFSNIRTVVIWEKFARERVRSILGRLDETPPNADGRFAGRKEVHGNHRPDRRPLSFSPTPTRTARLYAISSAMSS